MNSTASTSWKHFSGVFILCSGNRVPFLFEITVVPDYNE